MDAVGAELCVCRRPGLSRRAGSQLLIQQQTLSPQGFASNQACKPKRLNAGVTLS